MSLLFFEQRSDRLVGLSILDAEPEWTLSPPRQENGWVGPRLDTGEGRGPWLSIHPESGRWSAVLHRDDAPYNTCLPPGEALLEPGDPGWDAAVESLVDAVAQRSEASFVNPFDLVVGRPDTGELFLLEHSFEGRSSRLEPGVHLRSYGDARPEPDEGFPERPRPPLSRDQLKALVEASRTDPAHPLWVEDARRPTRAAAVFDWGGGELHLHYAPGPPNGSGWRSVRVEPGR